jgi:plastocyanin
MRLALSMGLVWAWVASGTPLSAQTVLTGSVRVATRAGVPPGSAVVYALPLDRPAPARPGTFALTQKNKAFAPGVLGIPAGSTVEFPNHDSIFHNVFSLSSPAPFDLGLYRAGASKSRVFTEPASYRVFCNIHPQMSAVIVVAPTPWVTVTDRTGAFTLTLPPGRYRLTASTGRTTPVTRDVVVAGAAAGVEPLDLDERSLVEAPHTNKFGKAYPAEAYKQD